MARTTQEETVALMKRREELLKTKQEIEMKLKSAAKAKNNIAVVNENKVVGENGDNVQCEEYIEDRVLDMDDIVLESDTSTPEFESTVLITFAWDIEGKVLAVLTESQVILKSFNPSNPYPKRIIALPHQAGKETKLLVSNGVIGVSFADEQNYIYIKEKWKAIGSVGRLIWLDNGSLLIFNEKLKTIILLCCESFNKVDEIEDVERFNCNNNEIILLHRIDGSLTAYNPCTRDETIYLPRSLKKSSSTFNSKHISYFRHDPTDSTLLLILIDRIVGKLRVFVCGIEGSGAEEMSTVPVPKEYSVIYSFCFVSLFLS